MTSNKEICARQALTYLTDGIVLGIGSGTTVACLIPHLAPWRHRIEAVVASSEATSVELKAIRMPIVPFNDVNGLDLYIDGADEINEHGQMIKGGGGALVREKILASASKKFVCIAEAKKHVSILGAKAPIPIEVIPMARSFVARELVKLGGQPEYRIGFKSDNGHIILDCYGLLCTDPLTLEKTLNNIPGTVGNGVFAQRRADVWLHE